MPQLLQTGIRSVLENVVSLLAAVNRRRLPRAANSFVVGIHKPMQSELTLSNLAVIGTIPATLNGRYLRMGANPAAPAPPGHHWFLGDGMVHGIAIEDGHALWYRNRWIGSRLAAKALGRRAAPGPRRGRNDTVNTNIVDVAGRAFALVEAGSFPVELSDDLETQRYNPFDGTLSGSFTGHPHRDPVTGEHHAIAYDEGIWDRVRHVVISPDGKIIRDEPIPVEDGPCIHDCAFTDCYAIVLDLPVTFSMRAVVAGHSFPYRWNTAHRARVGLLPRGGNAAAIIWCDVAPCFVFHVANAHDREDDRVVLDLIAYDTMFASGGSGIDALGRLERWTINPSGRSVERRVVDATPQEFPRIDGRRFGRRHRFIYSVSVPPDGNPQLAGATKLYKHDIDTGERRVHEFGDDRLPGEFVFVPASVHSDEDEGWLIGFVIDACAHVTELTILDARAFEAPPIATVLLPHRVPPGFHGNWFARSDIVNVP